MDRAGLPVGYSRWVISDFVVIIILYGLSAIPHPEPSLLFLDQMDATI